MKAAQQSAAARYAGASSQVRSAISRAAQRTGVDFDYLWNQARTESSLDPSAKARTSSAAGLFQFIEQSWLGVIDKHGAKHGYGWAAESISQQGGRYSVNDPEARRAIMALRFDPDAASVMAGEFAADNADVLASRLGRQPNATDLYFAHFLGSAGAARFLSAAGETPDASAAALFPREAAANRSIFYRRSGEARTLAEIYTLMGRKLGGDGSAPGPVSPMGEPSLRLTKELPGLQNAGGFADERPADLAAPLVTAMAERGGKFDVLRPNPQSARLAYMLVVSSLDA